MQDRRQHQRLRLRLAVSTVPADQADGDPGAWWTSNISAGGMYYQAARSSQLASDRRIRFQLAVPPGEGYSGSEGTIGGTGEVLRVDSLENGTIGVAVRFAEPLTLAF